MKAFAVGDKVSAVVMHHPHPLTITGVVFALDEHLVGMEYVLRGETVRGWLPALIVERVKP
jgi:hypothetical protein